MARTDLLVALLPDLRAHRLAALRGVRAHVLGVRSARQAYSAEVSYEGRGSLRPFLRLRSGQDWTNPSVKLRACFFEHSLSPDVGRRPEAPMANEQEIFNRFSEGVIAMHEIKEAKLSGCWHERSSLGGSYAKVRRICQ